MVDINLHGVIFGSKLALKRFLPRGRGHLVNIASSARKVGFPGGATYCATKHAVVGLSEAIRPHTTPESPSRSPQPGQRRILGRRTSSPRRNSSTGRS